MSDFPKHDLRQSLAAEGPMRSKLDVGEMEVDIEERHITHFNEALVGSQTLDDSISDDDSIEVYAGKQDHGDLEERIAAENHLFLSRWDAINWDGDISMHSPTEGGGLSVSPLQGVEAAMEEAILGSLKGDVLDCHADMLPHAMGVWAGEEAQAGSCPEYAAEMLEIEESNSGIDFGTECFHNYLEWNLDNPGHADAINAKLPRVYDHGFRLRPMLYLLIRYTDELNPIELAGIAERLHGAFHGHMDLLMEVEVKMPNLNDDAAETMKTWMSNHPSSAVLIVLATDRKPKVGRRPQFRVVQKALGPSYQSVLVKNHSPIRGLLVLGPGEIIAMEKHPSQLKCWGEPVRNADLTWVVGFTNPNLYLGRIMSSLPEFIFQVYFKTVLGRPNVVSESLIWSFASPWVLDHTCILFIELSSPTSIYPVAKEIIKWTPNMPWGIPLQPCPTCKVNWSLKASFCSGLECAVKCHGCGSEGSGKCPDDGQQMVFLKRRHLKDGPEPYILATFPKPAQVNVEWKSIQEKEEGYIRRDELSSYGGVARKKYEMTARNYWSLLGSPDPRPLMVVYIPPQGEIGAWNKPFADRWVAIGPSDRNTFIAGTFMGGDFSLGSLSTWVVEKEDADVVVLLQGQAPQTSDICLLLKHFERALGGLFKVIFNPEHRGYRGIVALAPGLTTPASLAQFEQLTIRQSLSWIMGPSHSGFNPGSMVDLLPDLFFHLMVRREGDGIRDLVDKVFNRPWALGCSLKPNCMKAKSSNSGQREISSHATLHAKKLMWLERQVHKDRAEALTVGDEPRLEERRQSHHHWKEGRKRNFPSKKGPRAPRVDSPEGGAEKKGEGAYGKKGWDIFLAKLRVVERA
ncbi:hypothetical protein BYT27DRAFT_7214893 [Phlegmacium glaucopus]|nr:hypothetical protein BYT27DRAFT_7214893 [Phlegmacium glaucopus]